MDDDRTLRDLLKGRLAMTLVCARVQKCPRRDCARKGRCLGRLKQISFHAPIGDCPNMSAAEWQAVSLGLQRNLLRLKPSLEARQASAAGLDRLSWAEQQRRYNAPEAVAARAEAERRAARQAGGGGPPYAELLWYEPGEDGLSAPRDLPAAGRRLVGQLAAAGCFCARGAGFGECAGCPALGEGVGGESAVGQ